MQPTIAFIRRHPGPWLCLATAALFAVLYLAAAGNGWGYYRHLSQAFLSGRLDVDARLVDPQHAWDFSLYQDRFYYPMGVLPALVLLPGVALMGLDFPQGALVVVLAVAIGLLVYRLARRAAWPEREALWLTIGVCLASPASYLVLRGATFDTYLTHLLQLACLLAALVEYLGRRRWWLMGALLGLSVMARPLTALGAIFFLAAIFRNQGTTREKKFRLAAFAVPLGLLMATVAGYNALRFENPLEFGYRYQLPDMAGNPNFLAFSTAYAPGNFYRAVLAGPVPIFAAGSKILLQFPYLTFDGNGTSMLLTWPMLLLLFFINFRAAATRWSLIAAGAVAGTLLFSFATGYHQYGYRYGFDFVPFLLLALVSGLRGLGAAGRILVIAGIALNAWLTLPVLLNLPLPGVIK